LIRERAGTMVLAMDAQRSITMALSRTFRWMQERRAARARRVAWLAERLGLARAQEARELASRVDLALGRLARLREAAR
jgi:hypothetical protein